MTLLTVRRSVLLLALGWLGIAMAFVPRRPPRTVSTTRLYYISESSQQNENEHFRKAVQAARELTPQELNQARAAFERLLQRDPSSSLSDDSIDATSSSFAAADNDVPLLTSAGRRLRELEIQLLESLIDSDGAIDQLVHLWTTERSTESAHALLQMQHAEQPCSAGLVREEAALAELCRLHPGWAEPWSRLATLLFYKGIPRWSDALSAAEEAIRIKPWHFEALNVCRLILQQMDHPDNPDVLFGCDDTVADLRRRCQRLSRLSLPKLEERGGAGSSEDTARQMWVARAVATARYQVRCAEQQAQCRRGVPVAAADDWVWQ